MCWYTEFHNCEFHKYMKNKPHIFVNKSLQYRMRKSTENQPVARYSLVLQGSGMTGTLSIPACCCPSSASTYGHGCLQVERPREQRGLWTLEATAVAIWCDCLCGYINTCIMYVYACYGVHYMCILHRCVHISRISLHSLYSTLVSSPTRLSGFIITRDTIQTRSAPSTCPSVD